MVVGLGTGDTAAYFIRALSERVRNGLQGLRCVATSSRSAKLGQELGLEVIPLDDLQPASDSQPSARPIAITVDGADEIDPQVQLIKGAGGALLFEKLVAQASAELVIVADPGKLVKWLGQERLLPVEVVAFGARHTLAKLRRLPEVVSAELRTAADRLYTTDGGNHIVDMKLRQQSAGDLSALQTALRTITGVIETGLFLGEASRALIGHPDGSVEVLTRSRG